MPYSEKLNTIVSFESAAAPLCLNLKILRLKASLYMYPRPVSVVEYVNEYVSPLGEALLEHVDDPSEKFASQASRFASVSNKRLNTLKP